MSNIIKDYEREDSSINYSKLLELESEEDSS